MTKVQKTLIIKFKRCTCNKSDKDTKYDENIKDTKYDENIKDNKYDENIK